MTTSKALVFDPASGGLMSPRMAQALDEMRKSNSKALIVESDPGVPPLPGTVDVSISGPRLDGYPDLSGLTTKKIPHKDMVLDGVCTQCACCGQPLTDAVSVQRGLGPRCSRKGYSEDPVDGDEMAAFICLAEFQELIEFLTEHYKPLGVRGLVNGLVRVASLNRPCGDERKDGNEKLFRACCETIEALGHPKMANLLRETLVVAWLSVSDLPGEDGISYLRTKAYRTPGWFRGEATRLLGGASWDKKTRTFRIPLHEAGSPVIFCSSKDAGKSNKRVVWELLLKAFPGSALKINGHAVPIRVNGSAS